MESVILVIHLFLALAIIGLVLLQRSEGGGLGIGGGGGGLGGLASAQGTANALTRITGFCAAGFFVTSLLLGILAANSSKGPSLIDSVSQAAPAIVDDIQETGDVAPPMVDNEESDIESNSSAAEPVAPITTE